MTSATTAVVSAPADSIFAVMSPSDVTSSSLPTIPRLGMMIDRTSFDETDDFGVNHSAMNISEYVAGPPVIMKDGKVRRRLRWRPKSMAKRRRQPPGMLHTGPGTQHNPQSQHSSNASVVSTSNYSQNSRLSKKSLHSFASTETASINNTTKKNYNKFPLPRPILPMRSHANSMATIGTEGDLAHARFGATLRRNSSPPNGTSNSNSTGSSTGNSSTLFAAAYDLIEEVDVVSAASSKTSTRNYSNTGRDEPSSFGSRSEKDATKRGDRRNGLPPRFQRPTKGNPSSVSTPSTSAGSTSPSDSLQSTLEDNEDRDGSSSSPVPIPTLSGDEVETERRLDLRIPSVPSTRDTFSQDDNDRSITAAAIQGDDPLTIYELRNAEDRQDHQASGEQSVSTNSWVASSVQPPNPSLQSVVSDSFVTKFRNSSRKGATKPVRHAMSSTSSLSSKSHELRFSMSQTSAFAAPKRTTAPSSLPPLLDMPSSVSYDGNSSIQHAPSNKTSHTCPVDVDNGTFLEAEKNLQAIHEMASEHLRQGECSEALEVFEEILRGQLARYGEDHHRVGTALHNIGIVLMRRGDYTRALDVYKEAVRVRKNALDPFHPDVAASLAQLGVAYMERGKYRKAIGAFREALRIRRKCLGNDHPKVGKILNNIGCSLFELDELEVSKVAFEEALDIQRNLLRHPQSGPVSQSTLLSIASTQSNIASIKLYRGLYDEAIVDLEEALLIQQCALGDDHPVARRTQESLAWMERSRRVASTPVSIDLLTQLTGTLSTKGSREVNPSMVDSFYSRFDLACRGWDGYDANLSSDENDIALSPSE